VYYQPVFSEKMDQFEQSYTDFLVKVKTAKEVSKKVDQVLDRINALIGGSFPKERQLALLSQFQTDYTPQERTFYLLHKESIKDYLRKGNTLPDFSYDAAEDMVTYHFQMLQFDQDTRKEVFEMVFPIGSVDEFAENCQAVFDTMTRGLGATGWVGIHEVTEISLMYHIKPTDPYWRWFSDGVANAVTYRVLADCIGETQARDFIIAYDTDKHADIKDQINLQYWMSAQYCINTPLASQERIKHARYAYATYEVQRLVNEQGWDKLKTIVTGASQSPTRKASDLIRIIKEVTGQDMLLRLAKYQSFSERAQGLAKYSAIYSKAAKTREYSALIENILRIQELHDQQLNMNGLTTWKNTAMFLSRLGHDSAADQAMEDCMELFAGTQHPSAIRAAKEAYLMYAVQTKKPGKGRAIAKEFLKDNPDHVWALSIQLLNLAFEGKLSQAGQVAQKVLGLSQKGEVPYYIASTFLEVQAQKK